MISDVSFILIIQLEFLVDLNRQEQVDQVRKALANRKGKITNIS